MITLIKYCPAKINLFLEVGRVRADGYHDIETVMQKVSLYDKVTVTLAQSDNVCISVAADTDSIPFGEGNICYKAARAYLERVNISGVSVSVLIEKNIPVLAGLGGGSSDAAGVLSALNSHYNALTESEMTELAAGIGADVPFFIIKENTAVCRGIGEIMSPVSSGQERRVLIAMDGEGISAGEAYRLLDKVVYDRREGIDHSAQLSEKDISDYLYNAFELAVFPVRERARALAAFIKENGASASLMSGSGTAVYGLFDSDEAMNVCADMLKEKGTAVHKALTLS